MIFLPILTMIIVNANPINNARLIRYPKDIFKQDKSYGIWNKLQIYVAIVKDIGIIPPYIKIYNNSKQSLIKSLALLIIFL